MVLVSCMAAVDLCCVMVLVVRCVAIVVLMCVMSVARSSVVLQALENVTVDQLSPTAPVIQVVVTVVVVDEGVVAVAVVDKLPVLTSRLVNVMAMVS
ncbi:hypothetical protein V7S43_007255 [Phytophthora oleae]|uniref:Secreted protein n=1 Tax=Phytophthora oleae TaxID=2107226 RepID=A0ABD3FPD6_9STRA